MEQIDARTVIYEFLAELPDTIRTEEVLLLLMYCGKPFDLQNSDTFLPAAKQYLMQAGMHGAGAVICARAILDFRLNDSEAMLERAELALKKLVTEKPGFPEVGLLGIPLRKRHYASALKKWNALRADQLSDQNIRDFENTLLNPRLDK